MIEIHLIGQLSKPKTLSYIIEQALTVGVSPSTSSGEIEGQRQHQWSFHEAGDDDYHHGPVHHREP